MNILYLIPVINANQQGMIMVTAVNAITMVQMLSVRNVLITIKSK